MAKRPKDNASADPWTTEPDCVPVGRIALRHSGTPALRTSQDVNEKPPLPRAKPMCGESPRLAFALCICPRRLAAKAVLRKVLGHAVQKCQDRARAGLRLVLGSPARRAGRHR